MRKTGYSTDNLAQMSNDNNSSTNQEQKRTSPYGTQTLEPSQFVIPPPPNFNETLDIACNDQSCSSEQDDAISNVSSIVLTSHSPNASRVDNNDEEDMVVLGHNPEKLKNIKTGIVVISAAVTGAAIYYIGPFALKISQSVLDKLVKLTGATTNFGIAAITGATNDFTAFYRWAIQNSPITQFFYNALMKSLQLGKDVIYQLLIPLGRVLLQYAQSGIMNIMTLTTTLISTMIDVIFTIMDEHSKQIQQSLAAYIIDVLLPLYTISQFQFERHMKELLKDDDIRVTRSGYVRQNFGKIGSSENVVEILNKKKIELKKLIIELTDKAKVGITRTVVKTQNTLKYGKNQTKSGLKKTLKDINIAIRKTKNIYNDVKDLPRRSYSDFFIMVKTFKERGNEFRDKCINKIDTTLNSFNTHAKGYEESLRDVDNGYDEDVAYILERVGALSNVIAKQGQSMISRVGIYQTLTTLATIANYARQTGPIGMASSSGGRRTIKRGNKKKKKVSMQKKRNRSIRIKKKRKKGTRRKN